MATRKRRTTATTATPSVEATSPNSEFYDWMKSMEDNAIDIAHKVGEEAPTAPEEETEAEALEKDLSVALNDTFSAMQKAEEEKGIADFFDPSFYDVPKASPAPPVKREPKPRPQRYILRNDSRRRKN